jgi:hypothetical protein
LPPFAVAVHRRLSRSILFFQAENDHGLAPSLELAAAMKEAGKPFEVRIFPAFGSTPEDGHAFGYFGGAIWADDVFRFLDAHCRSRRTVADGGPSDCGNMPATETGS